MNPLSAIVDLDTDLFLLINGAHAPWADAVMGLASDMRIWFPAYALFLVLLKKRYAWKGLFLALPVIALMIVASDTGSVLLFKETVHRLRPCHEPALQGSVHLVNGYCGGQYGFVSSHASNHFAIAAFMAWALQGRPLWAGGALFGWAAFIGFSRIYLGVHYPGDVLVGGLYGIVVGSLFFAIFRRVLALRAKA
ncbi:MAG: phosphatase PAP2 family protein [Flavobacteriales bacterium]|nr:phosphatase PAP2 family protein [Flavobacteriales bacterium]MBK6754494.1 phosphatase PAP2 family protein [Flavobacteriales bacterium]MBK7083217.1 phosphatase PAP2 family protein [Flavobacteriales bacterium]MBK7752965.1 phosphatase PAP2 family protein [Flavobacteriales bacterium]MBK9076285.1 phosphatase PAP2 family protein [Flavobacteriales bacterium]